MSKGDPRRLCSGARTPPACRKRGWAVVCIRILRESYGNPMGLGQAALRPLEAFHVSEENMLWDKVGNPCFFKNTAHFLREAQENKVEEQWKEGERGRRKKEERREDRERGRNENSKGKTSERRGCASYLLCLLHPQHRFIPTCTLSPSPLSPPSATHRSGPHTASPR